jgi:putative ABC transport system permease protein
MHRVWPEIRYAFRVLGRRPVSSGVILLTLGLAIGANVSIFSVINGVLLSPLPFEAPDRLVGVWAKDAQGDDRAEVAPADFRDFQRQARSFEQIGAATNHWSVNLTGAGEPERLHAAVVSANFLSVLGIAPELGRDFEPQHDLSGSEHVVLLGHGLWQRRFGSDPGVVGKTINLNGEGYTVLGVLSKDLRYPDRESEVWLPLSFLADRMERRNQYFFSLVARLRPGIGIKAGRGELEGIAGRLAAQYPDSNAGRSVTVIPLGESIVGNVRPALYVLLCAVGCVLLIACANVASLVLSHSLARKKEIALRLALGAGRFQSARQLLIESLILTLLGGGLGLLLAHWGLGALLSLSSDIPRVEAIGIDGRVLGFTLIISVVSGLIVGILPALLRSARPDLSQSLKEGARTTTGTQGSRLRSLLIIAEIALSLVLLIGAGLLIKSFARLLAVQPGFDARSAVTLRVSLPSTSYPEDRNRNTFFHQLIDRIAALPGVEAVGATSRLPMTEGNITSSLTVESRPGEIPAPEVGLRLVSSDYFRSMRIPLLTGRLLTDTDGAATETSAVVNQTLAQRFWPDRSAVGQRIKLGPPDPALPWITVIGVVGDVHHAGLDAPPAPEVFLHNDQAAPGGMTLVVRTSTEPLSLISAIRRQVGALDPNLPVYDVNTLEQVLSRSVAERRFTMLLLGIFAIIALALASVGIYGGIAAWVTQHRHEIGTRLALGAQRRQILGLVVGRGMTLTAVGLVIGLTVALWMGKLIQTLLFAIAKNDFTTLLAVPLFLAAVALLACSLPAWRATRIEPMIALRDE